MYIAPARACTLACSVHWPRNQRHTPASSHGPMHARRRCHGALECTRAHAAADPCPARQPLAAARRRDRLRGRSSRRGGQPAPELAARDVRARLPPPLGPGSAPAASAPPARATRAPPARPVAHRLQRAAVPLEAAQQPAHEPAAARQRSRRREAAEPAGDAARFSALSLAADSACCHAPSEGWPAAMPATRLPAAQRLSSPPPARRPTRSTALCRRAASTPRPFRLDAAAGAKSRPLRLRQRHGSPPCRR